MDDAVRVEELFGIGKRYDVGCDSSDLRVSVIVHKDGHRELYVLEAGAEEPSTVLEFTEEQARVLGAVLAGTFYQS
jgi:K+/H+ antiporter YhaU regulatory subunit KhtT